MKQIKGPAIFLAQFISDEAPFNSFATICQWAANLGYKAIQLPTANSRIFDLEKAAQSQDYCDEVTSIAAQAGLTISELSTHLQGQLVAVHPAYDDMFDNFAPQALRGDPIARTKWAINQLMMAAKASKNLGLKSHVTFSGALLWHTFYPWPQRPKGLVEQGFQELAKRWLPILDYFDEMDVDVCYELHPGEDLHDGVTFERFLAATNNHPRVNILYDPSHFILQQLDYLEFIDIYHHRIKAFHVKDAEFNPNGRSGIYGGYQDWQDRPGRFRSLGDGQIDFKSIFSKLTQYGFDGWAVLEWECCIKHPEDGAKEGAQFIKEHLIRPTAKAFDDFSAMDTNDQRNKRILGI
ncbi:sugar phosphate isomerase/epimerase [Pseudoalteromonas sp. SG43-7]|uniref:sugar phosphate isomerase/epimerase family protein n=1 Tax=unclassified Pseudoalteromonas TaxID=194690 RepID=UPI001600BA8B|nr:MULTISPECIES: sugar phosphate isomerase/epimerase family protein [unclassified Pseudoalteromonas]MBB1342759.1 sugar phosphate isomerase/epimerase [Pseudoalteromonas sp. SR45-6]MBB1417567.1 sugar phosphate isomerase/epimerase [Pseudoalteromonas sp. SG44-1]MBB1421236.1 sugar phosphate isomerase/epimerase [Pseudoalteromonas sp. SG43-7]MBB1435574.1 sugar phosphate isomerase/epimerase [Pseudoalteromonas sp. SG43-6]